MTVTASFGKPFAAQVVAYRLRLRDLRGTSKWDDLWQAEHDRAFMVAGAMKAELLADLAAAVDKAIAGGGTLAQFRADFRALVEKNGWHGWAGEGTKKGEAWRTRVIYQTNLATSYAAGRWAQITQGGFPFIIYFHGNSREPRLQHLAWDGLVLPADHPFWATHAPPNGWGCSCYVAGARSREAARILGGDPGKELPDGWQALDPRTGAPKGIDRGWAYAPGASVARTIAHMASRTVQWEYEIAKAYMAGLPEGLRDRFAVSYRELPTTGDAIERYAVRAMAEAGTRAATELPGVAPYATLGLLTSADAARLSGLIARDVSGFDFALTRDAVIHVRSHHGNDAVERARGQRAVSPADYRLLLQVVANPDDVRVDRGDLVFAKVIDGQLITAVFAVFARRRMIALKTMWVGR